RWFVVAAFAIAAVSPMQIQAQVQDGNVRGGNRVNSVQSAGPASVRNSVASPSFRWAPMRSVNHHMFNRGHFQNVSVPRRFGSMGTGPRSTFRPPQRFSAYNFGNQRPAPTSGTVNLNLVATRIANNNPVSQGTHSNPKLRQDNNPNRASGSARNH